jgi:hypothetical protein
MKQKVINARKRQWTPPNTTIKNKTKIHQFEELADFNLHFITR